MRRIARRDLEALVFVAVATATAPYVIKRGLKSKLLAERDKARKELTRSICEKLDNGSYMVIVTELIGEAARARLGKWGLDEPMPATVPQPPPPPRAVTE